MNRRIILLVGLFLMLVPRLRAEAPILSTTTLAVSTETANWGTYRNESLGFEIKLPSGNWQKQPVGGKGQEGFSLTESVPAGKKGHSIQIHILRDFNPNGEPIQEWYRHQPPSLQNVMAEGIIISLGGHPAWIYRTNHPDTTYFSIFVPCNKVDILNIQFFQSRVRRTMDVFYQQILSTLQFL